MFSYKNNHPVAHIRRVRLPDGSTRTGNFSDSELELAGYKRVETPPVPGVGEKVVWFEGKWVVEKHNKDDIDKLWDEIRLIRNQKIQEIEWRYSRYYRNQRLNLPQIDTIEDLDTYVQTLADITKADDPYIVSWPVLGSKQWP